MSLTLLDPPTSSEVGLLTKSTALRLQFALESDAAGGPLTVSAKGQAGSTTLKALMGGQPFRAAALLTLFSTPTLGTVQSVASIMDDVQVTSCTIASSGAAASAVPPIGINWVGDVGGILFPFLELVAPATSAGGLWAIIIELRNSIIG